MAVIPDLPADGVSLEDALQLVEDLPAAVTAVFRVTASRKGPLESRRGGWIGGRTAATRAIASY